MGVKTTEDLLQELIDKTDNNRRSQRATPSSGGGDGGFGSAGLGLLGDAAKTSSGALNDLWKGTLNVSNGFQSLTGIISRHGGDLGKVLGDVAGKVGSAIIDTTASLNQAGQNGADFNMDIAEYDRLLKGARMTHEQYNDMIRHSATDLNALGAGMNKAQKNFLEIAKGFQESDIGNKFKELGWSTDELNDLTKTSMAGRKGADMSDPAQQRAAIIATEKLGLAMDENSRILGISRKDQMDALAKAKDDARLEAALQSMDPEARSRYNQALTENAGQGESFKRALKEAFTGKITAEGSEALASLGTAAGDVTKYGIALRDSSVEGQKQSQLLGEQARTSATEWRGSEGFRNMARYGDGGVADKAGTELITAKSQGVVSTKQAEAEREGKKIDAGTAIKENEKAAHNRSMGLKEDGTPLDSAGAGVSTTINKADRTLTDMFAGSTDAFGRMVGAVDDLTSKVKDSELLKPHTQEQMNPLTIMDNAGKHLLNNVPGLNEAKEAAEKNTMTPAEMAKPVPKRASGSPEFESFLNASTASFSSMFEKFDPAGTLAELHGDELVATPGQMERFAAKLIPEDLMNMGKNSVGMQKPIISDVKPPVINLPNTNPVTDAAKTPDTPKSAQMFSPKFEEDFIKTVNSTIEKVFGAAFAPIENIAKNVPKQEAPKPAEVKPAPKQEAPKSVEVKKEEPKPVEVKKEDHKPSQAELNMARYAEDAKSVVNKPEIKKEEHKLPDISKTTAELHKVIASTQQHSTTHKAPDVSSLDASLLNLAKFNKALTSGDISKIGMSQMDLSDSGKAAENKLGPTTAHAALQKKREALENASFDYEEMKAANTKPSLESAERLAKKKAEVSKLAIDYEEDLIKTKGKLKLHAESEVAHAEVKNKHHENEKTQQVAKAIADEKKFMKEHGPESAVTPKVAPTPTVDAHAKLKNEADAIVDQINSTKFKLHDEDEASVRKRQDDQAKSKDNSPGIFDKIGDLFSSDNKPAFASGNVKYEEIPQAEIDAKNKRMQESIGKIDNSPDAIAAQKAELDRQQNSGMYKQKEPEKAPTVDIKKPEMSKEDAHVKEMYKKFGLESFNDYNARITAEEKAKKPETSKLAEIKPPVSPTIKQPDIKPPMVSADALKPAAPTQPKPVEEHKPVEQPKVTAQVVEKQVSMKDILDAVTKLNNTMSTMAHHTEQTVRVNQKQLGAIQSSSNSRI